MGCCKSRLTYDSTIDLMLSDDNQADADQSGISYRLSVKDLNDTCNEETTHTITKLDSELYASYKSCRDQTLANELEEAPNAITLEDDDLTGCEV
jgi:hypothetical protein